MNDVSPLLRNFGMPPLTHIRWNGLKRTPATPKTATDPGHSTGCWLYCRHRFDYTVAVDWNRCTELLERIRPGHGLREPQARTALIDAMESHLEELDWPSVLVCNTGSFIGAVDYSLDHPLTAFVALGKCIGSLWLREQPWRLAPLNTPAVFQGGGTGYGRGTHWGCRLWFPQGLPPQLLDRVRSSATPSLQSLRGKP